jgi:lysozyme
MKKKIALALTLLVGFEGVRTVAYRDPVGIPTVCMGETRGVKIGDKYTLDECKAMAADRVAEFADGVEKALKKPVSDKTFAAFVSFSYNLGLGVFQKKIAPLVNAGKPEAACQKMGEYVYAKGVKLPGLVNRRREEVALCLEGLR